MNLKIGLKLNIGGFYNLNKDWNFIEACQKNRCHNVRNLKLPDSSPRHSKY